MSQNIHPAAIISLVAGIRERANALILDLLAERGVDDLLPAHGSVLQALFERDPIKMSDLAVRIRRKKNTVTGLIKTLEERGYCRREPDPQDARAQLISLTEKGRAMRDIQADISAELLRKIWNGIDRQEQTACVKSLQAVLRNLDQAPDTQTKQNE